ncbi:FAD-binding protein [Nocardiopsis sp. RSe5-2]|uniref:FAD-binding protein n=1 Tax=Nocardiopsis endophytica TaxID=3018445 RepID=A0ABT4TX02_9ACTN|nr:D-arabinono-1,4-lactone oxidase [Nocardiopsis endophytica]MDA2809234.1 FAD-binding protein [Nocardiopsis endophytica]
MPLPPPSRLPVANWARNVAYDPARSHRPASVEELRELVRRSDRIRALGSTHSFSPVIAADGDVVRTDALPGGVTIDDGEGRPPTATVAAGMTYTDVCTALDRAGYALGNLASLPNITIAGACATATHGSGDTQRCLSASVSALELVGPQGDIVELSRATHPDTFPGAVVSLGALGIVTRMTLDVEPAYSVAQRVLLDVPLDEPMDRFDEVFGSAYSVSAFTDWASGTARLWLKERVGEGSPGGWTGGDAAREPVHPVPGRDPVQCTGQLGADGPWHERLPHFLHTAAGSSPEGAGDELQSEYFVPRENARAAIEAVRGIGRLLAPLLYTSELRSVRGDDLWLSPAYGRDSAALHFTWVNDEEALRPAIAALEERLLPLGARPHWAKLTGLAPRELIGLYERAADFKRLAGELDPSGKFRNPFVDALLAAA